MLQPGTHIGRYEIQRRLGRGGMGTVYVAQDPLLGRIVAIKVFHGDIDVADASDRFAREARSAAALNQANVVTIHDYGEFDGQPYLVMEYIQGETLAAVIRRKAPVGLETRIQWLEELAAGVAYAHREGIVHRDIKPTNLMVDRSSRLKVLDFGIARMMGTLSSSGTALIGTPGYMAPEQVLGAPIDQRSDLFSMGVVAYELLSYCEAFPGDSVPAVTHRILSAEPRPLQEVCPDAPPELVSLVEHALKKSVSERVADAESFGASLKRIRRKLDTGRVDVRGTAETIISYRAPVDSLDSLGPGGDDDRSGLRSTTPRSHSSTRDELAQRRRDQIDAALDDAQAAFDHGQLDHAIEACLQALTLDEGNTRARALETAARVRMAQLQAEAMVQDARVELERGALTTADDLLQRACKLVPDSPEVRRLERDLRLARVEQERIRQRAQLLRKTLDDAERALEQMQLESALALAREVRTLDPTNSRASYIEAEALRRLDLDVAPTVLRPIPQSGSAPTKVHAAAQPAPARTQPPATAQAKPARTFADGARETWLTVRSRLGVVATSVVGLTAPNAPGLLRLRRALPARVGTHPRFQLFAWGTLVVLTLAVVLTAVLVTRPPASAPEGQVVVDAVPWATVAAIEAEDGRRVALPQPAATPLVISLPEGSYRVRLVGPPPASIERVLTVRSQPGRPQTVTADGFDVPTLDAYFDQYLAPSSVEPTPGAEGSPVQEVAAP